MKLQFLDLAADERRFYIDQAATQRNLSGVILEKDFWVSWLLAILFNSEFAGSLVFKGGTSLSKVFGVIDRFSEDIDLSVSPEFLNLPVAGASRNQSNKWMKRAEAACSEAVGTLIAPRLEQDVVAVLGEGDRTWFEFVTDPGTNSPVLLFHYPTTQPSDFDYLQRTVKLEFGSLTDQRPVGRHPVEPLLADILPSAFADWQCEVVALELPRSFWEKATILHAEYYRPAEKPTPDHFSRHYADTAALAARPEALLAVEQHDLRERVVAWKGQFFGSAWARYDFAQPGAFRLVPPENRVSGLRRDDEAMRDMYLGEPIDFDRVLTALGELVRQINAAGSSGA